MDERDDGRIALLGDRRTFGVARARAFVRWKTGWSELRMKKIQIRFQKSIAMRTMSPMRRRSARSGAVTTGGKGPVRDRPFSTPPPSGGLDLDAAPLRALGLRHANGQHAVVEAGIDLFGIDLIRQGDPKLETADPRVLRRMISFRSRSLSSPVIISSLPTNSMFMSSRLTPGLRFDDVSVLLLLDVHRRYPADRLTEHPAERLLEHLRMRSLTCSSSPEVHPRSADVRRSERACDISDLLFLGLLQTAARSATVPISTESSWKSTSA